MKKLLFAALAVTAALATAQAQEQIAAAGSPEPSTYAMIGLGAALLVCIQQFRRRKNS